MPREPMISMPKGPVALLRPARVRKVTFTPESIAKCAKMSVPTLTAMVVGSMIGSGVFLLPRRFGVETGVLGALIAWATISFLGWNHGGFLVILRRLLPSSD